MSTTIHSDDIQSRHVLVLGGAGFLGSTFVRSLLKRRYTVTVYDSFLYAPDSLDGIEAGDLFSVVRGDIRDSTKLRGVIAGKHVIVNLAAIVGDAACDLDRDASIAINAEANRDIYRMADELGVQQYVCASTCSVYGFSDNLLNEESFLNPVSLYAQTKLTSELLLFSLSHKHSTAMTVLRFATLFGWSFRPRFDLVVNTMTSNALADGVVNVYGGNQWRPHLHVADAAEAITTVIEAPAANVDGEIFNVGGNEQNMTILELARNIEQLNSGCSVVRHPDIIDPRNYLVDFSKIRTQLGFRPRFGISDGVAQIQRARDEGRVHDFKDPVYSNVACLKAANRARPRGSDVVAAPFDLTLAAARQKR